MSAPSNSFYQQRPPSAEDTFRRLVGQSAGDLRPVDLALRGLVAEEDPTAAQALPSRAAGAGVDTAAMAQPTGDTSVQFRDIYTSPENQIFKVVFFPDRIFHAQYLNACRAPERYRYAVSEARSVLDVSVLKAQVFMDGRKAANLIRIEYRAGRLVEQTRESGRFLRDEIGAWLRITMRAKDGAAPRVAEARVKMRFCPWVNGFQVEIWQTLEPPTSQGRHDFQVAAQMGPAGSITRVRGFAQLLADIDDVKTVELAFSETDFDAPTGHAIQDPNWDNNYERNYQAPNSSFPSANDGNTVKVGNYLVDFQKGWFLDAREVAPVRYRNAMMDPTNREFVDPNRFPDLNAPEAWSGNVPAKAFKDANVIEMRWILQREFAGSVVFFHEVTIQPGAIEGTHCHIGSEELYYIVSGEGLAYMAQGDDPETNDPKYTVVERDIYGLFPRPCVELPVRSGNVIFTKSGGVHGIRNTGAEPLRFVAFLYHSV